MLDHDHIHLAETLEETELAIAAAEGWDYERLFEEQYRKDPVSFAAFLKAEQSLVRGFNRYFKELSKRAGTFIDYAEYSRRAIKAYDVVVEIDSQAFAGELVILNNMVIDDIAAAMGAGSQAGEALYTISSGLSANHEKILRAARLQVGKLIRDINATTRKRIRRALEIGIDLGEDNETVTRRIEKMIWDPKRADLIARTESVNAYSTGLLEYGKETGALKKKWRTVQIGACPICIPLDGKEVPLGEDFKTDIGPVPGPSVHPRCRCTVSLVYPKGS